MIFCIKNRRISTSFLCKKYVKYFFCIFMHLHTDLLLGGHDLVGHALYIGQKPIFSPKGVCKLVATTGAVKKWFGFLNSNRINILVLYVRYLKFISIALQNIHGGGEGLVLLLAMFFMLQTQDLHQIFRHIVLRIVFAIVLFWKIDLYKNFTFWMSWDCDLN
jgi:hypothetical protein